MKKMKSWFIQFEEMIGACLLAISDPLKYPTFEEQIRKCMQNKSGPWNRKGRESLGFGMVTLLKQFNLHSSSTELRQNVLNKLLVLLDKRFRERRIVEEVFETLAVVAAEGQESEKENTRRILLDLEDSGNPVPEARMWRACGCSRSQAQSSKQSCLKSAMRRWLQGRSVERRLGCFHSPPAYSPDNRFFCAIRQKLELDSGPSNESPASGLMEWARSELACPTPVVFFKGRTREECEVTQELESKAQLVIARPIVGQGGIGKTQFAMKVCKTLRESQKYKHEFWIPSNSRESLVETHIKMGCLLGIEPEGRRSEVTVQNVRAKLDQFLCLYVFDDAPCMSFLEDFMPRKRGHVLITSRAGSSTCWPTNLVPRTLRPLDGFDAVMLAQEFGFSGTDEKEERLLEVLANVPSCPLTLAQLFSTFQARSMTVTEWVEHIEGLAVASFEQVFEQLDDEPHDRIKYQQNILDVVQGTMKALKESSHAQRQPAQHIVACLCYMDTTGVPIEWALSWNEEDTTAGKIRTKKALDLLERLSLICRDGEAGQLHIHAEVQVAISNCQIPIDLAFLVDSLTTYVGTFEKEHQNFNRWMSTLSHARTLFRRLTEAHYNPNIRQRLAWHISQACHVACLFEESVNWAERRLDIVKTLRGSEQSLDLVSAFQGLGRSLDEFGEHGRAKDCWEKAMDLTRRIPENCGDHSVVESMIGYGDHVYRMGDARTALKLFEDALSMLGRVPASRITRNVHIIKLQLLNDIANCHADLNDHETAMEVRETVLSMAREVYGDNNHPHMASCISNLGSSFAKLNKKEEAFRFFLKAKEMRSCIYQERPHRDLVSSFLNLSWIASKLGKNEESLDYSVKALVASKKLHANGNHEDVARALHMHGRNLARMGQGANGLQFVEEATLMMDHIFGENDHPLLARCYGTTGLVCLRQGHSERAQDCLSTAYKMVSRLLGDASHPTVKFYKEGLDKITSNNQILMIAEQLSSPSNDSTSSFSSTSSIHSANSFNRIRQ